MRKMRVASAGGSFELIEESVREPDAGYARVRVQACGICHSDSSIASPECDEFPA